MPRFYLCLLTVLAISLPALLHGQATGAINGAVYDSTGALVPAAAVTVTNTGMNQTEDLAHFCRPHSLSSGLWHEAAWQFLAWGGYHGSLLAFERWIGKKSPYEGFPALAASQ